MPNSDDGGPVCDSGAADEFDDAEDDRPRFCSLDPPSEIHERRQSYTRRGKDSYKEFSEACRRGQLNQVKDMVERGGMDLAEVDESGQTVVHIAASHRHCHEVLAYLLEKGASLDKRDNFGAMPLHSAASSRNAGGIRLLLQWGAAVDVRDTSGHTPLFTACKARAHRVIVELLERGASPSVANEKDAQTPLHALLYASQESKAGSKGSKAGFSSPGALTLRDSVDSMIKAGAPCDILAVDRSGRSVVDVAAAHDLELLHYMLLNCNLKPADALFYALKHGDTIVAKELLDGGKVEPCTIIDHSGSSLLHVAAAQGKLECVKLLLAGSWLKREGALSLNIDARDTAGRTALFNATLNAHVDVAAFLLDHGASPAIQDGAGAGVGYTFADTVTAEEKSDVCQLLARWGSRSGNERERAESSASVKAPGGEVVYFSGVVPFVHKSKTEHLWAPANVPPPPAVASARHGAVSVGVGRQGPGPNPWRGTAVDADTFEPISSDGKHLSGQTNQEAGGMRGGAEIGGAAKYAVGDSAPRSRRGKSSASAEKEGEVTERESRMASEPGPARTRTKAFRKHSAGGKGKSRRRGSTGRRGRDLSDQTEGSAGHRGEPAERPRFQSEASESATRGGTERSTTARLRENAPMASDSPRNQHRKLRPLAIEEQTQGASDNPAVAVDAGDGAPAAILTPSAPSQSKPSRTMKTFW